MNHVPAPAETVRDAREALTRAAEARVPPTVLRLFERKLRRVERALATTPEPASIATREGMRLVVERAQAGGGARARTPEQSRALEGLRARLAELEGGLLPALGASLEVLERDTARLLEAIASRPAPRKRPRRPQGQAESGTAGAGKSAPPAPKAGPRKGKAKG
jgi:hypothetical protein